MSIAGLFVWISQQLKALVRWVALPGDSTEICTKTWLWLLTDYSLLFRAFNVSYVCKSPTTFHQIKVNKHMCASHNDAPGEMFFPVHGPGHLYTRWRTLATHNIEIGTHTHTHTHTWYLLCNKSLCFKLSRRFVCFVSCLSCPFSWSLSLGPGEAYWTDQATTMKVSMILAINDIQPSNRCFVQQLHSSVFSCAFSLVSHTWIGPGEALRIQQRAGMAMTSSSVSLVTFGSLNTTFEIENINLNINVFAYLDFPHFGSSFAFAKYCWTNLTKNEGFSIRMFL